MRARALAAVLAVAAMVAVVAPSGAASAVAPYRDGDYSVTALNILPPGQGGHANALEFARYSADGTQPNDGYFNQLKMYEDLVAKAPNLAQSDLPFLFKDASFGVTPDDIARTYSPRSDVTIIRDKGFNVPHVYGSTRAGTMFGAGYVSAEDRLFMMDVLRHVARGTMSGFLGASPANVASDRAQRLLADYTEEELEAMGTRLSQIDPTLGALAQQDLEAFSAGVNAAMTEMIADPARLPAVYAAVQQVPLPWKPTDSIALATLIGGTFSVGGGGQLDNDAFLDALEQIHSPATARAIFDDMKSANDIEAPTATETAFPFNDVHGPFNAGATARPDNPSSLAAAMKMTRFPEYVDGPFGQIRLLTRKPASNALLVDAAHSSTGRPLTVFGPQVGYYSPEILMEIDMHGPGIHARGAAFPGISLYVLLGRGARYGWSATTAIGDHTDIRAVKLCNTDGSPATLKSTGYERDGVCREMYRRTDTWLAKPTAVGVPQPQTQGAGALVQSHTTERVRLGAPAGAPETTDGRAGLGDLPIGPDWAIVLARGTVGGEPAAFVRQRASYGIEVDATLAFTAIHDPARVQDIDDLNHAFGDYFSFSFNWHFVTDRDMGFYTTGRYPVLADGVDPELPFWGDSQYDWQRYLGFAEHPHSVNESKGWVANWNNKQAPRFRASDDWFSYGSVGRVHLLEEGIEHFLNTGDGLISPTELTQAMGIAATRDLRAVSSLGHVLDIVGTPSDPALANAVSLLTAWLAGGAHRRDLDGDRSYEHAGAIALMDALWNPMLDKVFGPALGPGLAKLPEVRDDAAGAGGSAYLEGWYGQLEKDLRTVRGLGVLQPFSRGYCGNGVLADCRTALTSALTTALSNVNLSSPTLGSDLWKQDGIKFASVGVINQRQMHWQNRPTFQQVLEFN